MIEGRFRLYNKKTIKQLEALLATGQFATKNDLYQEALARGVEELHTNAFGKWKEVVEEKHKRNDEQALKAINFMKMSVDEMFVSLAIVKHLVTTMYNVNLALMEGETVDKMLVETGVYSSLPKALQDIENNLQKIHRETRNKNE